MKFTYSSGSRPLEGYTIKRGIGHGGFGEVYYALSDAGKEVALKLVRGNHEIELRGMAQCLNLKHPNLVALYDIRTDSQGDSWVIMEYISGESLSGVLNRHPQGLPKELIKPWFLAIGQAVGHLHESGIVHRDLKPGNIFVEDGLVKVGDYGLCKFISSSQRSAQTQSVGTVHYMAPEISTGNYGKQVDIYAAGIILYEMLTGQVPFQGESAGEILMKHLTTPPDLSKLPREYANIVGTALAKNPSHRYPSFGDMARAVEPVGAKAPASTPAAQVSPLPRPFTAEIPVALPAGVNTRGKIAELSGSLVLAVVAAAVCTVMWIMVAAQIFDRDWTTSEMLSTSFATFYLVSLCSWAVLLPAKFWEDRRGDPWLRRGVMLIFGLGVGAAAYWLNGWTPGPGTAEKAPLLMDLATAESTTVSLNQTALPSEDGLPVHLFRYMTYFGLAFCLVRWWKLPERFRTRRFAFYPVLLIGVVTWVLFAIFWGQVAEEMGYEPVQAPIALIVAAAIVQVVSPHDEPPPRPLRRVRLRYA